MCLLLLCEVRCFKLLIKDDFEGVGKQLNFALAKGTHASSFLLGSVVGEQQETAGKGALVILQLFARDV